MSQSRCHPDARLSYLPLLVSLVTGCASTPGSKPHDMSVARHEGQAQADDTAADKHAAQHDPNANERAVDCSGNWISSVSNCWSSTLNPSEEHLKMAERHRKMAADHRAASQALRDAEGRACVGLLPNDRDMSPFQHREDIARVEPLDVRTTRGGPAASTTSRVGTTITFRPVPGLTSELLQRIVSCHLARNASMGHEAPEMPYCPLVPKGTTASVTPAGEGLKVDVRSDDPVAAQEILRRAQALVSK